MTDLSYSEKHICIGGINDKTLDRAIKTLESCGYEKGGYPESNLLGSPPYWTRQVMFYSGKIKIEKNEDSRFSKICASLLKRLDSFPKNKE